MRWKMTIISVIILQLLAYSIHAREFLPDLVINYSNFSYIHSVAVGFKFVYFGTTHGVTRYNISESRWDDPLTGIEGLGDSEVFKVRASFDDEKVWAQTESGVYEYTSVFNRWDMGGDMPAEDANGQHLKPDFNYIPPTGYDYLNTGILIDQYNNQFPLTDVVDDGWSNLWIGTWGLGALRANNTSRLLEILDFGLLQDDITAIYSDMGILWMGGIDTGYGRTGFTSFDWEDNSFEYIETTPGFFSFSGRVNDIAANDYDVFVGTDDGLYIVDKKKWELRDHLFRRSGLPDDRVTSLLNVGDTLYVGTDYGLGIIDIYADTATVPFRAILPEYSILSLKKIGDYIWIGTHRGAFRMNLENGKLGRLNVPDISGNREIKDIEYSDDKIWLVIDYELKSIDRKTADVKDYPEVIQYNGLNNIAVRDTLIAAATSSGLLLIVDGKASHYYLYTESDGLISNQIRDLIFDGDYIWLGTDRGLSRFWYRHPSLYF